MTKLLGLNAYDTFLTEMTMNEQQKVNEVIQRVNELTELAVSSPDGLHEVAAILGPPINIYQ